MEGSGLDSKNKTVFGLGLSIERNRQAIRVFKTSKDHFLYVPPKGTWNITCAMYVLKGNAIFSLLLNHNNEWMRFRIPKRKGKRQCLERLLTANAKVAKVMDSIPASSDTVESGARQIKQSWL